MSHPGAHVFTFSKDWGKESRICDRRCRASADLWSRWQIFSIHYSKQQSIGFTSTADEGKFPSGCHLPGRDNATEWKQKPTFTKQDGSDKGADLPVPPKSVEGHSPINPNGNKVKKVGKHLTSRIMSEWEQSLIEGTKNNKMNRSRSFLEILPSEGNIRSYIWDVL